VTHIATLWAKQLLTSESMPRTEYLIPTDNVTMLYLILSSMNKCRELYAIGCLPTESEEKTVLKIWRRCGRKYRNKSTVFVMTTRGNKANYVIGQWQSMAEIAKISPKWWCNCRKYAIGICEIWEPDLLPPYQICFVILQYSAQQYLYKISAFVPNARFSYCPKANLMQFDVIITDTC